MGRAGIKSVVLVYQGDACLGEAEVYNANPNPNPNPNPKNWVGFPNNEIRISRLSPPSDRCPPLSVLHTISPFSLCCKLRAKSAADNSPIALLYLSCFHERKTAVVVIGDEELHLVAMPSKVEKVPSFWCCSVRAGMYGSCLGMLNLRCLAIVFDLDETLIVANTMKSFEDRIDALSRWIDSEDDPARISGMSAELKRYVEDRELLKQYIESDSVRDNGNLVGVLNEEVPPISGAQERILRPVIRLQEKNIVLTRINPEIRDTSVLVRLRPAWEDLRSYLTAKGRKRFEVYVCTMAERDYALEMWRLLDPEAHLISSRQLLDRVVCVKSGSRKSLLHVFQDGFCHPKMAMVIDDRLKVWDDKDQPRVHVVPAFAPYYAPQAETANAVPVLCVARNVACNVRGGFFKEFDENLLHRIFELCYENVIVDLPSAPDVSDYLISEDTGSALNGNRDVTMSEGINGADVERRMNQQAYHDCSASSPSSAFEKGLEFCWEVKDKRGYTLKSYTGDEPAVQNKTQLTNSSFTDDSISANQARSNDKDLHAEVGSPALLPSSLYVAVLKEIGRRCDSKVDFRPVTGSNKDLQFSVEVLFGNEKIGTGMGRTRKEAQLQAAENALRNLASNYISFIQPDPRDIDGDLGKISCGDENGFLGVIPEEEASKEEKLHNSSTSEQLGQLIDSKRLSEVLSSIKELCIEGQNPVFQDQAPLSMNLNKGDYYFQVVVAGQILGMGVGSTREEARLQAAEEALKALKESANVQVERHSVPSRLPHVHPTKRSKE